MTNWVLIPVSRKTYATVTHLARPGHRSACGKASKHHDQIPFDPDTQDADAVTCAICRRTHVYHQFSDRQQVVKAERIRAFWAAPPEVQERRYG